MDEAQKTAAPPAKAAPKPGTGVKDTIESILVAFILAFIFRAFVVEAFVIPTGSMAPTLLGAHTRYTCEDCGHAFVVNYPANERAGDVEIPPIANKVYSIHCPNCGFKIPKSQATAPVVHYGDRILVLKYLYLLQEPTRWDVVVFKSPTHDPDRAIRYQTNYIKRLIGRPGESVMVLDGDIYISQNTAEDLSASDFKVQTKPRHVQDALWRIVYDNDFHPRGRNRAGGSVWKQPWQTVDGSGWDVGNDRNRRFRFDNLNGGATLSFNPAANPNSSPLTDWLAYNQVSNMQDGAGPDTYNSTAKDGQNAVNDLKLSLTYDRIGGDGPLMLRLSKYDTVFTAEIHADRVRVLMQRAGNETVLIPDTAVKLRPKSKIEFQDVDYQATLRVNDEVIMQTTPQQYAPDVAKLINDEVTNMRDATRRAMPRVGPLPSVQIVAARQTCELSHISLWRDIYYTNRGYEGGAARLAVPNNFPRQVARLNADEYFVMGDNSPMSWDARFWPDPVRLPDEELDVEAGRVPGRFMLGKAFFVYWPAGYRPLDLPRAPSIIPNFGQMRFID